MSAITNGAHLAKTALQKASTKATCTLGEILDETFYPRYNLPRDPELDMHDVFHALGNKNGKALPPTDLGEQKAFAYQTVGMARMNNPNITASQALQHTENPQLPGPYLELLENISLSSGRPSPRLVSMKVHEGWAKQALALMERLEAEGQLRLPCHLLKKMMMMDRKAEQLLGQEPISLSTRLMNNLSTAMDKTMKDFSEAMRAIELPING